MENLIELKVKEPVKKRKRQENKETKHVKRAKFARQDADLIQLTWIDRKARPAFLCTNNREHVKQLASTDFPNLIVYEQAVRQLSKGPHIMTWIII